MTDYYTLNNTLLEIMCDYCTPAIHWKCNHLPSDVRFRTKMHCMRQILRRDDEMYPTELPTVK